MEFNYEELIETYNEYIQKLPHGCLYIAEELQKNNFGVMQDIINFSEGLEWMSTVSTALVKKGINSKLNEEYLNAFLEEINEGLNKGDLLLVADLFEYEIAEYFKKPLLIEVDVNVNK